MGNYAKTLFIGCGGAGIRTLIHLNQLLSIDPNHRYDARENISYLVIDTDRNYLREFESHIHQQMRDTDCRPIVETAHIMEGLDDLKQIVSCFIAQDRDIENFEKIKKHWMFSPDGEPFRGDRSDIRSQSLHGSHAAYLAAWKYMQKLEEIVMELVNQIRMRNAAEDSSRLQVFLVASLAGDAGRGIWHLVAFKVRQILQAQGIRADINAVFFDSSCYPNICQTSYNGESDHLIFNSYAGMSELSAWLRLMHVPTYCYSLPSLDDPASDVIKISDNIEDPAMQSPISRAFLIFGSNGNNGELLNNNEYYKMAATALYSILVNNVRSFFINSRFSTGSFGAAKLEVDACHLLSFFETAVRKKFVESLYDKLDDPCLSEEVDQLIGSMHAPEKGTLLDNNCLWLPESISADPDGVSLEAGGKDKNLSLLQKIFKVKFEGVLGPRITQRNSDRPEMKEFFSTKEIREVLRSRMKDQDKWVQVKRDIEKHLQLSEVNENKLTADVNAVLAQFRLDGDNLIKTLNEAILDQIAPDADKKVSLSRCILFALKLKSCFEKYISILQYGIVLQGMPCHDLGDVVAALEDSVDKAYKEDNGFLGLGKKFNEREIESICERFQYSMYGAIFFKLRPVLVDFYQRAIDHLEVIAKSLDPMVEILKRTNNCLDKNLEPDFGPLSCDEIIKSCFIDPYDSDSVLKSIPEAGCLKDVFSRQLKPVLSTVQLDEILSDPSNICIERKPLVKGFRNQLQDFLETYDGSAEKNQKLNLAADALETMPEILCQMITDNVKLEDKAGPVSFLEKYFSFGEILSENIKCWNKLLRETPPRLREDLNDRLNGFLGITMNDHTEDGCLDKKTVLIKIILQLVENGKPRVKIIPTPSEASSSRACNIIMLPFTLKELDYWNLEISDLDSEISTKDMRYDIICRDGDGFLPSDRIIVFNCVSIMADDFDSAPFDRIENLTHWKDDPEIKDLLLLAENPRDTETAMFERSEATGRWIDKTRANAYLSPIFEQEPLKSLRWHPWLNENN